MSACCGGSLGRLLINVRRMEAKDKRRTELETALRASHVALTEARATKACQRAS
jgi:hypothetical protein